MYDHTLNDIYNVSVPQSGGLQVVLASSTLQDNSEDPNVNGSVIFFTYIDDGLSSLKD